MRASFVHVHASGRFDAHVADVRSDWDDYRATPGVKLITGTEHGSGDHDPAFKGVAGWGFYRGHECVVSWREDTFELAWEPSFAPIAKAHTFNRGSNKNAKVWLTSVPLRHIATGRVVMVRVCHTPSSVQAGDRFRPGERRKVGAWTASLARWGARARRFTRDHPHAAQVDVADWNVDLKRKHWQALIGRALGQRCAWAGRVPAQGTHGRRLIDGVFYRLLEVSNARVLPKGKSSDHKAIATKFEITPKETR